MSQELVALLRYQIPSVIRLSLVSPGPIVCQLPESRIRQCLLNLILNAAQAIGARPGDILIAIRHENEQRVAITVTDDGPGFSDELLATGIRPFATGKQGGTGLGLAMVQRFTRELGGQLRLGTNPPRGGQVRMIIPLRYL
jgi:signal transduction histidine kinase